MTNISSPTKDVKGKLVEPSREPDLDLVAVLRRSMRSSQQAVSQLRIEHASDKQCAPTEFNYFSVGEPITDGNVSRLLDNLPQYVKKNYCNFL